LLLYFSPSSSSFYIGVILISSALFIAISDGVRSSVLVLIFLLTFFLFCKNRIFLVICFSLFTFFYVDQFVLFLNNFSIFNIFTDVRWELYSSYINSLDFYSFIFGSQYPPIIEDTFSNNPHNSYIRLHYKLGIFSLIFLSFYFYIYFLSKNYKHRFYFSILFFALLIRVFFDSVLMFTIFDFFLFSFLFYPIKVH